MRPRLANRGDVADLNGAAGYAEELAAIDHVAPQAVFNVQTRPAKSGANAALESTIQRGTENHVRRALEVLIVLFDHPPITAQHARTVGREVGLEIHITVPA